MATKKADAAKKKKVDSYANAWNNFGLGDSTSNTGWLTGSSVRYSQTLIDDLFRRNWLFRAIVMSYPTDATRKWITIQAKDSVKVNKLMSEMNEFGVKTAFKEALAISRLYGGSAIVLGIDDGSRSQENPLNMDNIKDIKFLNVIDRWDMAIIEKYDNPLEPNYGEAKIYEVGTRRRDKNRQPVKIHESRLIVFKGDYMPTFMRNRYNGGWGDSILVKLYDELRRFGVAIQAGSVLFQDFITKVLSIPNLVELLERDPGAVQTRLREALIALSSHGLMVIGDEEDFKKVQTQITGLTDLQNVEIDLIAAAAEVPRSRLLNQEAGNLSAAQETTRVYYDDVHSFQENELRLPTKKIVTIFMLKKDSAFGGKEPEGWSFFFNDLWQMSDLDRSITYKNMAIGDKMYRDGRVLLANEIRETRFTKEGYSIDTDIDGAVEIPEEPVGTGENSTTEVETNKSGKEAESNTGEATKTPQASGTGG